MVQTVALVDAGVKIILDNKDFIMKIADNAKLFADSGFLTALGPIGMAVGLGLNVLTLGLRLYNGESIFAPVEEDKNL